jgi:hypothetical protein
MNLLENTLSYIFARWRLYNVVVSRFGILFELVTLF